MLEPYLIQPQFWILPLIGLILILLGFVSFFLISKRTNHAYSYDTGWHVTGVIFWVLGVILALAWTALLIPFDSKYHMTYKLSGTVESVTNTLQDGGDGERTMTPVVKISGYEDPVHISNPSIVTLKGKEVDLTCSLEWIYQGMPITNCSIRAIK